MPSWVEATKAAIMRHVAETGSAEFTRRGLEDAELDAITAETGTTGITPGQTLGRELQQLRDAGFIEFLDRGSYRWLGAVPQPEPVVPSKAVFVLDTVTGSELPEHGYTFAAKWLLTVRPAVGQWIIYQNKGGYRAAARVDRIGADHERPDRFRALIARGSFLEFGRAVPLQYDGRIIEQALRDANGSLDIVRAMQPVRVIAQDEFDRIIDLALIDDELPRSDIDEEAPVLQSVFEERSVWEGPIDRATMLVNRKVRDQQFRKRVLNAYGSRCALTGMKLINGGGRAETEAAHIMSVEAGGPDKVNNGIALSGTVHWMFDRGLISLSDAGDILLSRAINDRDRVERLIHHDRRARLPMSAADRPHPAYLHWHRTQCFHD